MLVIRVDQLSTDYLHRFREHFGAGGSALFLDRGAEFPATRFLHVSTSTCPGHAVVRLPLLSDRDGP